MDSTEDSWLGADVENLKQLDNTQSLPTEWANSSSKAINLKNQGSNYNS